MSYHDSNPVHNVGQHPSSDLIALKRETRNGEPIIFVYPGPVRLTLAEWASAIAFTTPEGENADTFARALALVSGEPGPQASEDRG